VVQPLRERTVAGRMEGLIVPGFARKVVAAVEKAAEECDGAVEIS